MRISSFICFAFFVCCSFVLKAESGCPSIIVVGDSHSLEFLKIPNCRVLHIGPHTMHRVGRDGLSFINLVNLGVQEKQIVIFAFGEIDARCHIGKQKDLQNKALSEIVDELVIHYIYTILLNRLFYNELTCIVYSVTPPTDGAFNPSFPFYGTLAERVEITKLLNYRLAVGCQAVGIPFLDVYDDYAKGDGTLIYELSDGNVHINAEFSEPIRNKLYKIISQ